MVDVIIPTYKPSKQLFQLIQKLEEQTIKIHKIILVNTEEKYYNQLIYGTSFLEKYKNLEVYHCSKKEFDHGNTRNSGVRHSDAEYFICMTQDAIPQNEFLIEELIKALEQPDVAVAYGRQLPNQDCGEAEKFTRHFNYPEVSIVKSREDIATLGIKTYFCSNVCAIYRRELFQTLGGFITHTIFNEDMIYAAKAIKAGYKIAYAADAQVIHSHNYTNGQQFHRNFDLGVSQADFPEIFAEVPSESEGKKMIKSTVKHLKKTGNAKLVFPLYITTVYKYVGYQLGLHYKKLPKSLVVRWSMNRDYWRRDHLKRASANIDATKGYGKTEAEMKR